MNTGEAAVPARESAGQTTTAGAGREAYAVRVGLLLAAVALVAWVRVLPLSLSPLDGQAAQRARMDVARRLAGNHPAADEEPDRGIPFRQRVDQWIDDNRAEFDRQRDEWAARLKAELSYRGADGRDYVYLGDYDSYTWLQHARTFLRTGTTCDALIDGECRDTHTNAPLGRRDQYRRSLHIAAIVGLHRVLTLFDPDYPLPASAFLVPVIVGVLGVFPAFAIGRALGGTLAGWAAAVLIGINPIFLQRSMGSDSDVWNVVLPLFMIWAGTTALRAPRLGRGLMYAVLAAVFAALHAATWRGWIFTLGVLLAGLVGNVVILALRHVTRTRSGRVWQDPQMRQAVLVFATFSLATALLTTIATGEAELRSALHALVGSLHRPLASEAAAVPAIQWPDVLSTVAELGHPNLGSIAVFMGGQLFFFVGWLGLLVLLLPRRGWQWWHFVILIGGNYLYRYLLTATGLGPSALLCLLAAPLVVAVVLYAFADDSSAEADQGAALAVVLWFVGALFLSFSGLRFVMLLVPPFAIACGVAIGRLYDWLQSRAAATYPRHATMLSAMLLALFVALLIPPIRQGYHEGWSYKPRINDAWWDAMTRIRDETPAAAVVNSWWDYGYWIKYIAERRVSADGGSLLTHIPHWLGRAFIAADETETVGLLRMLDCGSDATPEPEGRAGAYGRLVASGIGEDAAHAMVVRLAGLSPAEGRAYLTTSGLSEHAANDVLAASHCTPPPAYLVLSSELINQPAWKNLGAWDPKGGMGPPGGYLTTRWQPCTPHRGGVEFSCPVDAIIDRANTRVDEVSYVAGQPGSARLRLRRATNGGHPGDEFEGIPGVVFWAGATGMERVQLLTATHSDIGVLVDVSNARVLLGSPRLLGSTFTQLMYLDGRYTRYFEKFDERTANGERLVTWTIHWDGRTPAP